MTQFTLSVVAQNAINYAVANGPGTDNANYLAAYTAIYYYWKIFYHSGLTPGMKQSTAERKILNYLERQKLRREGQ